MRRCKCCKRELWVTWSVKGKYFEMLPEAYQGADLCLECFARLLPRGTMIKRADLGLFYIGLEVPD